MATIATKRYTLADLENVAQPWDDTVESPGLPGFGVRVGSLFFPDDV